MSLAGILADIAAALEPLAGEIPGLGVKAGWWEHPTPPAIDVYPASTFQTPAGMGAGNAQTFWTVRARVLMADVDAGQQLLLRLLDPADPACVEVALEHVAAVVDATGFTKYTDDAGGLEAMLGCQWNVTTFT